jgi:hypothetical protein
MKKTKLIFTVLTLTILMITSCTVQRRYHRKGFNINGNHSSIGIKKDKHLKNQVFDETAEIEESQIPNETNSINQSEISQNEYASSENKIEEIVSTDKLELPLIEKTNNSSASEQIQSAENNKTKLTLIQKVKKKISHNDSKDEEKKPLNGWALTAFILSIISLFASFYGALFCALLVIIFSLIASNQIKANPDKYRGEKLALIALLIVTIAMALWSVIFLLL